MNWILRTSGALLLLLTVLPLVPTGKWYVRWWDFPRLQIAILLAIPLTISIGQAYESEFQWAPIVWALLFAAGLFWQLSHVIPFSPVWKKDVSDAIPGQANIKFMMSNLDYENSRPETVIDELRNEGADVLLLVEVDEQWVLRLTELRSEYPYRQEEVRGEGLGIAVWSKLPFKATATRHLVSDRRASLWVQLETRQGNTVNFVGLHPTPPGLLDSTGDSRRHSRIRDAELILVSKEVASRRDETWVIAGDFNDVAWSHTTRLFKRTSGLLDPRIGRGLFSTYLANVPPCRCPIDHIFVSEGFAVTSLDRKRITGSDHFAVLATLALVAPKGVRPQPRGNDKVDARQLVEEGIDDANTRDVR